METPNAGPDMSVDLDLECYGATGTVKAVEADVAAARSDKDASASDRVRDYVAIMIPA